MKTIPSTIKQFITNHIFGLRNTMALSHFKIDVEFVNLKDADMTIEVDYRYLDAQILIDRETIIDDWYHGRRMKILEALSHELTHVLTQEMTEPFATKSKPTPALKQQVQHFEERVTEHVSRLVLQLYFYENKIRPDTL